MARLGFQPLGLILLGGLLSSCAVTYPVAGNYDDYNAVFRGTVHHNLWSGGGSLQVMGVNFPFRCQGEAVPTYHPPRGYAGGRGIAELVCEDGTGGVHVDWTTTSLTTGFGFGQDREGRQLRFAFGMSEEKTAAQIQEALRQSSDRPPFPVASAPSSTAPGSELDLPLLGLEAIRERGRPAPRSLGPSPPVVPVRPTP